MTLTGSTKCMRVWRRSIYRRKERMIMAEFYIEKRVYYHDTDAGGVMYYARYLEHLEEARTEFCRSRGIDTASLAAGGIIFPVVHLEIDYKSPARYGDILRIYTSCEEIGKASVRFAQEVKKDSATILKAKTVWACVDAGLKVKRIPDDIRSRLPISS